MQIASIPGLPSISVSVGSTSPTPPNGLGSLALSVATAPPTLVWWDGNTWRAISDYLSVESVPVTIARDQFGQLTDILMALATEARITNALLVEGLSLNNNADGQLRQELSGSTGTDF